MVPINLKSPQPSEEFVTIPRSEFEKLLAENGELEAINTDLLFLLGQSATILTNAALFTSRNLLPNFNDSDYEIESEQDFRKKIQEVVSPYRDALFGEITDRIPESPQNTAEKPPITYTHDQQGWHRHIRQHSSKIQWAEKDEEQNSYEYNLYFLPLQENQLTRFTCRSSQIKLLPSERPIKHISTVNLFFEKEELVEASLKERSYSKKYRIPKRFFKETKVSLGKIMYISEKLDSKKRTYFYDIREDNGTFVDLTEKRNTHFYDGSIPPYVCLGRLAYILSHIPTKEVDDEDFISH